MARGKEQRAEILTVPIRVLRAIRGQRLLLICGLFVHWERAWRPVLPNGRTGSLTHCSAPGGSRPLRYEYGPKRVLVGDASWKGAITVIASL
jgi:hypothetical protein